MKKILLLFAVLTTVIYTSCSSDDSESGSSGYTSITMTSNSYDLDIAETATFQTKSNTNIAISSNVTYYVNDVAITGNTHAFPTAGTYNVYSKYQNGSTTLTSATVQIAVSEKIRFNKRVLIEDFIGTWCGYCPRVAYAIDQVNNQTTDATVVAIHRGSDPYNFTGASALETQIGLEGYPTAMLNRTIEWTYPEPSYVSQAVNLTSGANPYLGIALVTSTTGNTSSVEVKVKFGKTFSNLKVVVYALENDLIYNQTNYTAYYGGTSTINNFEHDHVLRAVLSSSILGESITGSTAYDDEFTKTFTHTIPAGQVAANVKYVAFVIDSSNKALNSREAGINETQSFEVE